MILRRRCFLWNKGGVFGERRAKDVWTWKFALRVRILASTKAVE